MVVIFMLEVWKLKLKMIKYLAWSHGNPKIQLQVCLILGPTFSPSHCAPLWDTGMTMSGSARARVLGYSDSTQKNGPLDALWYEVILLQSQVPVPFPELSSSPRWKMPPLFLLKLFSSPQPLSNAWIIKRKSKHTRKVSCVLTWAWAGCLQDYVY